VSGSGTRWAICKSASCSRQITTPAPHRSVFYRPDALPATQPTSKHWRHEFSYKQTENYTQSITANVQMNSLTIKIFQNQQIIFQGPDLQNISWQSYDNTKVTIHLRQRYNLEHILRSYKAFLRHDSRAISQNCNIIRDSVQISLRYS